jgi:hypothetical protein
MKLASELLSRKRINTILDRHYGSKRALARELGVSFSYISRVLRGRDNSLRVLQAAEGHALQYLSKERRIARKRPRRASSKSVIKTDKSA